MEIEMKLSPDQFVQFYIPLAKLNEDKFNRLHYLDVVVYL